MDDILFDHIMDAANSMLSTPTIFKYFDIVTGVKVLENQNIAFSRPDRFNDPFDCSVELLEVDATATRKHMSGAFVRMLGNNYAERFRLKRQLDKATDNQVETLAKNGLKSEYTHRGVSCFSTKFDEILMWAHYCKNHAGICIGFDTIKLYKFLRSHINEIGYFPINYVEQLDKRSLYPVSSDAILYMLKTKSKRWAYESEVRITGTKFSFNEELLHFVQLSSEIFTQIYIGINVCDANLAAIIPIVKGLNPEIQVFRMKAAYSAS